MDSMVWGFKVSGLRVSRFWFSMFKFVWYGVVGFRGLGF